MRYPFNGKNRATQAWSGNHYGLDVVGDDDKTVRAVVGGKVLQSRRLYTGRTAEWGNYVSIQGTDGKIYFYCHLASRAVSRGQAIAEGAAIGIMGNTGKSRGTHLHLQIRNSAGREINVADVIGMPNKVGTYYNAGDGVVPKLYIVTLGPVSAGDRASVEALAKGLNVPCSATKAGCKDGLMHMKVGAVSEGDKKKLCALAETMLVACGVVEV